MLFDPRAHEPLLELPLRPAEVEAEIRARRFAMHSAAQVAAAQRRFGRGRYTVWTGDLGTAIYLQRCLAAGSELPAMDAW